ncbi:hypothetical protein BKP35_03195 [Anaerobacillus arseniciselenatis]|uniref:Uncharacterized protein n=1 Tax=Anaerobacillus arseniciselenatis TaxID=85682 RepID=A0A1S2LV10_9BACI|nr:hypothetical protein [Anaerobacillus arseniciselenatis]OIJ16003.1 hypothetical protein BKP35_03195 [Anaerobacillus arseniciselenatis]
MQDFYVKIHEYLNMDEEISFEEFDQYYKKVTKYFSEQTDDLEEDDIWKGLFIIENLMSNADNRAKEVKGSKQKKYKKMSDRSSLWAQNFAGRLYSKGYTEDQLNERFEQMFQDYEQLKS